MLEPIAIVYFPFYHNDSSYVSVFNKYLNYIFLVNLFVIAIGVWLSWVISKNLTQAVTKFSDLINRITLFEKDPQPIRYYQNDELNQLVKAYNKMILQIKDQKERLSFIDKEEAWREMAKQVAHEVKNPLTPMKLTIQNFERKFDPEDPNITDKVKKMSKIMVDQIDLVATVANAFSQFAQLPEKHNETFDINKEIVNIIRIFSDEKIYFHSNKETIMIEMDKIYLSRIITNVVSNASQATDENRENIINVDVEQRQKRIIITVEDSGVGIPQDLYGRIFEPNFTSKSSGMGLGLTMVRKMVEDYRHPLNPEPINISQVMKDKGRIILKEGGSINDIYASKFLKKDNQGFVFVPESGEIGLETTDPVLLGKTTPDYTLGWNNSFAYKGFGLNFLINGRFGGVATSSTQAILDKFGVSQASADARDQGGFEIPNQGGRYDAKKYYDLIATGDNELAGYYTYSATNVRVQEASLSYTFPASLFNNVINRLTVSVIANNPWMIYNKAPYDPELTPSTSTYGQGNDYFMQPSLRSFGFGIKVKL